MSPLLPIPTDKTRAGHLSQPHQSDYFSQEFVSGTQLFQLVWNEILWSVSGVRYCELERERKERGRERRRKAQWETQWREEDRGKRRCLCCWQLFSSWGWFFKGPRAKLFPWIPTRYPITLPVHFKFCWSVFSYNLQLTEPWLKEFLWFNL